MPLPPALARCVGGDVDRFLSEDWGRRARLWPSSDGCAFADLLTLCDVEAALTTSGLRTPFVRVVREGQPLPPASYTKAAHVAGQRADGVVDAGRVLRALEDGATIVLQSMQRWRASMAQFCRELELVLTHPVQANAYLTPSGATGLAAHHDTHDVFVLQLHGTKRWRVSDPVVDAPLARHRSTAEEVAALPARFETDLAPGDALYLPRGFVHSAQAQQGLSLHLTIGVLAMTGHDVVLRVAELAAEDLELRRALPPGWAQDPAVATAAVAAAMSSLTRWLGAASPAELGEQLTSRFWSNRQPLLEGQLRQLELLDEVDDATMLRVRPGSVCRARVEGGRLELTLGDRFLTLPSACEAAVARLLAGPVELGSLADLLDEASRLVLARRLVREGLLVIEDPSPRRRASSP